MKVIGVRGSGETAKHGSGYGKTVKSLVDWVRIYNASYTAEYVNYRALGIQFSNPRDYIARNYNESVGSGISSLRRHISGFLRTCKRSKVALAGLSQGAQVVADTYLGWLSDAERARVSKVVLFGDPKFRGTQPGPVNAGTFSRNRGGIVPPRRTWPSRDYNKVRSYCIGGDPVCNFTPASAARCLAAGSACVHSHYRDLEIRRNITYTIAAAQFITGRTTVRGPPGGGPSAGDSGDGSSGEGGDADGSGSGSSLPAYRLASELAFIRSNHSSGQTEAVIYHGSPHYTTLLHQGLTGYPATSEPDFVKALALDVNGDAIDELGFVRFNHGSGQTELVAYHGSPHYTTLLHAGPTGYPAISDPQNVTPVAIDINGDGIDELAFIRSNHSSGQTEAVIYHGSPHYTTLLHHGLTGYPAISDPPNVTPVALDVNGDRIDELAFVRSNHGSGSTEIVAYHGSPHYTTLLHQGLTGYPATSEPDFVKALALDVNGDAIDELGFVRFNHGSSQTELVAYHGSPHYTTLLHAGPTGYPAISDPQNVTPVALQGN